MVTKIQVDVDFERVISGGTPCIVFFSAMWSGPSKMIRPYFSQLSEEYKNISFWEVDADELEDIAFKAGVSSMPTFNMYQAGELIDQLVGASNEKLLAMVKKY